METLSVATDLHCEGCVNRIKPILEQDEQIKDWHVDLDPELLNKQQT